MKRLVLSLFFLSLITPSQAATTMISGGGGYTQFTNTFGPSVHAHAKTSFISDSGFGIEASIRYIVSEGAEDGDPDVKMVPLLLGGVYYVDLHSGATPYLGVSGGGVYLSEGFSRPLFTLGGKAGVIFNISKDLAVYTEVEYITMNESEFDILIQPIMASAGLTVKLGQRGKKRPPRDEKEDLSPRKRRKAYEKRRKERRRRDTRYDTPSDRRRY